MAKGYPDYTTFLGRAVGTGDFQHIVSSGIFIGSGSYNSASYEKVPDGYEDIFVNLVISCNDDSALHTVDLIEKKSGATFFSVYFRTTLQLDLSGFILNEGEQLQVDVYNNASSMAAFFYTITFLRRKTS